MTAISATLPAVARPPCDQFGQHLMRLRQERRLSARALAIHLGQNETYIYQWEHKPIHASREVLQRVVETLELDESERRELFRLADLRDAPASSKDLYQPSSNTDSNLLAALLRVRHRWPGQPQAPNAQSDSVKPLLAAAGWALARAVAHQPGILPPASIRWPQALIERGAVRPPEPSLELIDPHPAILNEELSHRGTPVEEAAQRFDDWSLIIGIARTYKRLLFTDPAGATAAVSLLSEWTYERTPGLHNTASLIFRREITARTPIIDVACQTVADVEMVLLANALWPGEERIPDDWKLSWAKPAYDAFRTIATANPELFEFYEDGQDVRDAIYALDSGYVDYGAICERFGLKRGDDAALIRQLKTGTLDTDTRKSLAVEPHRLAAVKDPAVLLRYLRSLEALVPSLDNSIPKPKPEPKAKRKRR